MGLQLAGKDLVGLVTLDPVVLARDLGVPILEGDQEVEMVLKRRISLVYPVVLVILVGMVVVEEVDGITRTKGQEEKGDDIRNILK